jgi:hypothetical protein
VGSKRYRVATSNFSDSKLVSDAIPARLSAASDRRRDLPSDQTRPAGSPQFLNRLLVQNLTLASDEILLRFPSLAVTIVRQIKPKILNISADIAYKVKRKSSLASENENITSVLHALKWICCLTGNRGISA